MCFDSTPSSCVEINYGREGTWPSRINPPEPPRQFFQPTFTLTSDGPFPPTTRPTQQPNSTEEPAKHAATAGRKQTSLRAGRRGYPMGHLTDPGKLPPEVSHANKPNRVAGSEGTLRVCLTRRNTTQNCHLDRREISICTSLIERGINPEALAVSSLLERERERATPLKSDHLTSRRFFGCPQPQTTIKELRKGAQEAKIELETRKQQK